jgi:hypothetical protein
MLEGRYTDAYLAAAGRDAPKFTDQELAAIGSPVDFAGINVYRPNIYVAASDEPPGYRTIPISASHPTMAANWHIFDPEVMYWAPRQVTSIWAPKSIFIRPSSRLGSGPWLCGGYRVAAYRAAGVPGGLCTPGVVSGVLDAYLALQTVRIAEEDAEDRAEVGDEMIAGAAGDQPVPDPLEGRVTGQSTACDQLAGQELYLLGRPWPRGAPKVIGCLGMCRPGIVRPDGNRRK